MIRYSVDSASAARRWTVPAVLTLVVYAALGSGLWLVSALASERAPRAAEIVEIDMVAPPQPLVAEPTPVEPEPPPEAPPKPPPEPERPEPRRREPPPPRVARIEPEPPPAATAAPAPGPDTNNDPPAPMRVFRLPDQGPGGSIPVARGRTSGSARGVAGGTGTNTGGGGDDDATGTGAGPGRGPVSIASLKRLPKPLPGQDFVSEEYPPDAKRAGIEGQVKVRLVIDDSGKVTAASVVSGLGYGLDQRALTLGRRLRFEPALDQRDQPVPTAIVWTFSFSLPE